MFYVDRATIARRQEETLRDAANERLSMLARQHRTHVRWLDRLVGLRLLPAA